MAEEFMQRAILFTAQSAMLGQSLVDRTAAQLSNVVIRQAIRWEKVTPDAVQLREWTMPILISTALYLPIVYGLKMYYKQRPAFGYRVPLIVWNATLSLLSFAGSLICLVRDPGIFLGKTDPTEVKVDWLVALVVRLFCITKVVEYGDTFWLCVKKRPTIFLHLYHHITVSLYCLNAVLLDSPIGHLFAIVNLNIHAVMYGYYAAAIVFKGNKFLNSIRPFITISQLVQMLFGICVCAGELFSETRTHGLEINSFLGFVMYVSYAYLFGDFFVNNYKKNLSSIDTLFALTPPLALPVLIYGLHREMLDTELISLTAGTVGALVASVVMRKSLLTFLSPIYASGREAKKRGLHHPAIRAFARRGTSKVGSRRRMVFVMYQYSVMPVVTILADSMIHGTVTIRSLPVVFTVWALNGALGGAYQFDRTHLYQKKDASSPKKMISPAKTIESSPSSEDAATRPSSVVCRDGVCKLKK